MKLIAKDVTEETLAEIKEEAFRLKEPVEKKEESGNDKDKNYSWE